MSEDFSEHYDVIGDGIAALKPESLRRSKKFVEDMNNMNKMPIFTRTVDDELAAAKARIVELEKALERIKHRADAYVEACEPMYADASVQVISDICAAALLNKEPSR